MTCLTLSDIAIMLHTNVDNFSKDFCSLFNSYNWQYKTLSCEEKEKFLLYVLKKIQNDTQKIADPSRTFAWENGWKEQLSGFSSNTGDIIPKFVRKSSIVRLNKEFVEVEDENFELNFIKIFQEWFFKKYINSDYVYEFGCGSGMHLAAIAEMFPDKTLYGCDFVQSAVDLINLMAERQHLNLTGKLFDMINPDDSFVLHEKSSILTFGAIEQLAGNFIKFIDYILKNKPSVCLHVEPVVELYDADNIVDYTAIMFHKKRGYTEGFLPYLLSLQERGIIDVVCFHRMKFGSVGLEGYNYIVWKPI